MLNKPYSRGLRGFPRTAKKFTAACLALSLGVVAGPVWAQPQVSVPPTDSGISQGSNPSAAPQAPAKATIPAPSPEQSARARKLFDQGVKALKETQSARAIELFDKARQLDPANGSYLAAYEIARQQQVGTVLQAEREDRRAGNWTEAKNQLRKAMNLDPGNPFAMQDLQSLTQQSDPAVVSSVPMPQFSSGLVALAPSDVRATFHLRAGARQVIQRVLSAYGVTAILDDSVPQKTVRLDLNDASFSEASRAIRLATNTFLVPLDSTRVLVAKDTEQNRAKFERLLLETVYLPGMDSKEMSSVLNLIHNIFGVKQASERPESGTVSIRAPQGTLRAINATLSGLYLAKPQVVLDIRVYQISSSRQEKIGLSFPQTVSIFNVSSELNTIISQNQSTVQQLIASGLVNPGDLAGIAALLAGMGLASGTVLDQPFALFGGGLTLSGLSFPGGSVNASLNLSDTKELDHVELRTGDLEKQAFLVGSRYPVVTQSYTAGTQIPTSSTSIASLISGGGQANAAGVNPLSYAPTVQYIDLGLQVKAVSHVVRGEGVTIQLQVTLASLAGASLNESPIINNRSFSTKIQVPNGGSALVASSISQSESRSLSGIPGLSELPGFSWTASPSTQLTVGKLLIVISPHIVSATHTGVASAMHLIEQASAAK